MTLVAALKGRLEDQRLVTGRGRYVADLVQPNLAHAAFARSVHSHARITRLDVSAAQNAPGVLLVLTARELAADGISDLPCGVELPRPDGSKAFQARRPLLVRERTRCVGDAVAMVIAETPAQAAAAAELVEIDYDPLPLVSGLDLAKSGGPKVWDEVDDNIAFVWRRGDRAALEQVMAGAAHVVRLSSQVSRVTACPLEPRGALGLVDAAGRLVLHACHQHPHQLKLAIARMFKVDPAQVRVIAGDVGGSFGMKSGIYPEDVLVLAAARRLGRPVRWIGDRRESFISDDHGRDVFCRAELALDSDGSILGLGVICDVNVGAYLSGRSMGLLNNIGGIAGVYRIPVIAAEVLGVFTNTHVTAPYRGAGRPEATYIIERLIDLAAGELGIDPYELRRRNLVPPSAMPYNTGFVFTYDCGEFEENMKGAAQLADLAGLPARKAEARTRGKLRGFGMANPIEPAGGPFTKPGKDHTRLEVGADGAVTLRAGVMSTGQGAETALTQLVAGTLGVSVESVHYVFGDTDDLPWGRGNGGSSSIAVGGAAVTRVLGKVIETGRGFAAELLAAQVDDVGFADGRFPLKGTNRSVGLREVAQLAAERNPSGLADSAEFTPPAVTFPNGCHMCEVEIDPETGALEIVRYTVVEDIGRVLNEQLAKGQIHGGVAQGIAQAVGEQIVYDPDSGQLLSGSFMDYMLPRAQDLPRLQIATREVPTAVNPLGAKGVGEAGTVGSLVATINAVCDALRPLGIRHIEMPATAARIWEAIEAAKTPSP